MKNVHILPTDKPSNLCIDISCGELNYFTPKGLSTKHTICQHIYITSDEEIVSSSEINSLPLSDGKDIQTNMSNI